MASPALLSVHDLEVTFRIGGGGLRTGRFRAVRGVSLTLRRGEIVALVGESGSGKSTIGRAIARLEVASAGRVLLDGVDVFRTERRPSKDFRKRVQLVFQDPFASLNPVHTIGHHIARPLLVNGLATRSTVRQATNDLLDAVELRPAANFIDKYPHELSGGQRQRVAIARALAPQPDILVADEPTSMLDVSIRTGVLSLLERLCRERELGILLITHDLAAARWLADRVLVLYGGEVMESLPAAALADARHPYTRALLEAAPGPHRKRPTAERPDSSSPPAETGCRYAPRCEQATTACREARPADKQMGVDHLVRCLLYGDSGSS